MSTPLTILFFGDICGRLGRQAVSRLIPDLRKRLSADLVIANGENMAHGKGVTASGIQEMLAAGIDCITTGDHCFDQAGSIEECYSGAYPIIRPANYAEGAVGRGFIILDTPAGEVLVINLLGRSFMSRHYDDPFRAADHILQAFTNKKFSAIVVDIHAETTAEKIALRHFLNGRISALLGTHTHVMTADGGISPAGTAYLTDVGMIGDADGVIGLKAEPVVASFLNQMKMKPELAESGNAQLNGVCLRIEPSTGRCLEIEPIRETVVITA